jgi:hypothetical protein
MNFLGPAALIAFNYLFTTTPELIFNIRLLYATMIFFNFFGLLLMRSIINRRNQVNLKVKVLKPIEEVITYKDHDLREFSKSLGQLVMQTLIMGFMHYKFEIVQPLVMNIATIPLQFYQSPLFQTTVLGKGDETPKCQRPWKEENPFEAFTKLKKSQEEASEELSADSKKNKQTNRQKRD